MVQADLPAIPHSQSTLKEFFFSESLDTASDSINICLEPGIYLQMRLLAPIALPLSHFVVDATKKTFQQKKHVFYWTLGHGQRLTEAP